jgi:hypothetical protein
VALQGALLGIIFVPALYVMFAGMRARFARSASGAPGAPAE